MHINKTWDFHKITKDSRGTAVYDINETEYDVKVYKFVYDLGMT